jgi:hypothetical protein
VIGTDVGEHEVAIHYEDVTSSGYVGRVIERPGTGAGLFLQNALSTNGTLQSLGEQTCSGGACPQFSDPAATASVIFDQEALQVVTRFSRLRQNSVVTNLGAMPTLRLEFIRTQVQLRYIAIVSR